MAFSTLALVYTYTCTAACQHCCYTCGPRRDEKMPYGTALALIRQASKLESMRTVAVTGGEPFLFFDELLGLCSKASSLGLEFGCITNCSWATTISRAHELIHALRERGLSRLSLSCDPSHQAYVPAERVQNVLSVAAEYDIDVVISASLLPWDNGPEPWIALPISNRFKIAYGPVIPVGRATQFDLPGTVPVDEISQKHCTGLNELVVEPSLDVLPCCGIGGMTPPLVLGSAATASLEELIGLARHNGLLRLIGHFGFDKLLTHAEQVMGRLPLQDRYISLCHLCFDLLSSPTVAEHIPEIVRSFENAYLDRFLTKAEWMSAARNGVPASAQVARRTHDSI